MTDNKLQKLKKGRQAAFISVAVSLGLAALKGGVGTVFNSQVLIADAVHSCADLMTHAASGFGLWIASKGKTDKFPYGLYRAETIAGMVVGLMIGIAGIDLLSDGWHKLLHFESVGAFPLFPIGASLVSSIACLGIAKMESGIGKAIGSKSLMASAKEAYIDVFTSLAVLAGIVLAYYEVPYAEGSIIILISCLLIKIGAENAWAALLILMDADLDPNMKTEIANALVRIKGVESVDNVKIRQSGPFKMVECIITARPELALYRAHEVADRAEEAISINFRHIESTFIHVEPGRKKAMTIMLPVADTNGPDARIDNHFARAPYYLFVTVKKDDTQFLPCQRNPFAEEDEHAGVKASRFAIERKTDLLLTASIGEISFHILHSNMIDIFELQKGTSAREAVNEYLSGTLRQMRKPAHALEASQKHLEQNPPLSIEDTPFSQKTKT